MIFFIAFLFSLSFISVLNPIIFFYLLAVSLFFSLFRILRWDPRLLIFFFVLLRSEESAWCYRFPSQLCFSCILQMLIYCLSIFMLFKIFWDFRSTDFWSTDYLKGCWIVKSLNISFCFYVSYFWFDFIMATEHTLYDFNLMSFFYWPRIWYLWIIRGHLKKKCILSCRLIDCFACTCACVCFNLILFVVLLRSSISLMIFPSSGVIMKWKGNVEILNYNWKFKNFSFQLHWFLLRVFWSCSAYWTLLCFTSSLIMKHYMMFLSDIFYAPNYILWY